MFPRILVCALLVGLPLSAQVTVVAVGDIACDPADSNYNGGAGTATACRMMATSDLALALSPAAVLLLGDNQYEDGTLAKYQASYAPTWGRLKAITHPIPGNHEYGTAGRRGLLLLLRRGGGRSGQGLWAASTSGAGT